MGRMGLIYSLLSSQIIPKFCEVGQVVRATKFNKENIHEKAKPEGDAESGHASVERIH